MKKFLRHTEKSIWKGRTDPKEKNLYLHELIKVRKKGVREIELAGEKNAVALLGYAVDEGVRRNGGRTGAADGPLAIRTALSGLANHFPDDFGIYDHGNLVCSESDLEGAHHAVTTVVQELLEKGYFPIIIGGGHDVAYPHYHALRKFLGNQNTIGIINLDAHFDLREPINGPTSGTPFFQIAMDCLNSKTDFKYFPIGIQKQSNNNRLFENARAFGVNYISGDQFKLVNRKMCEHEICNFMDKCDSVYLTIDMDGFAAEISPGVSAPSPAGFSVEMARWVLDTVSRSEKLISIDFAETNPLYDVDNRTAKLAAHFIYKTMELVSIRSNINTLYRPNWFDH